MRINTRDKLVVTTDCGMLKMSTAEPQPRWIKVLLDWRGQGLDWYMNDYVVYLKAG